MVYQPLVKHMQIVRFPVFGVLAQTVQPNDQTLFSELGYLSGEADRWRLSRCTNSGNSIERFREKLREVMGDLQQFDAVTPATEEWVGVAAWLRCLEAAQGTVLLADLGMRGTAASTLRTGYECLFLACAFWKDPSKVDVHGYSARERNKMMDGLTKLKDASLLTPNDQAMLASRTPEKPGEMDAFTNAVNAGLEDSYRLDYRALSALGSHPAEASLLQYAPSSVKDGRAAVSFQPDRAACASIILLALNCLNIGQEHSRAYLKNFG